MEPQALLRPCLQMKRDSPPFECWCLSSARFALSRVVILQRDGVFQCVPPGYSPDSQSLLQHLLRAGADLAFMWENDVLMVNRQAKPLWQDAVPLITGCRQARRPASPPGSTRPLFFYLRCKAEMPWGHSPENQCPSRVLRLPVIWVWFRVGGCAQRGWIPCGRVRFP